MAKPYRSRPFLPRLTVALRQRLARAERGQAIVVIAMAIFGLLVFIGLTVDAGILFIGIGHLRRAVDAAALAAAAQFREGRSYDEMVSIAKQTAALNGIRDEASLLVVTCDTLDANIPPEDPRYASLDSILCAIPRRKLVYVEGDMPVEFAFLTLIGFHSVTAHAESRSEAASVDVVLILDRSESMGGDATCPNGKDDDDDGTIDDGCDSIGTVGSPETNFYDGLDNDGDGVRDDGYPGGGPRVGPDNDFDGLPDKDDFYTNPINCNPVNHCHPFEEVKSAAIAFVQGMKFPYDRVSIATMDQIGQVLIPITDTQATDLNALTTTIDALTMYTFPGWGSGTCQYDFGQPPSPTNNPSGCVSSSTGGALKVAAGEFGRKPVRQEAVWVIVFITDGAANASEPADGYPGSTNVVNKWCPDNTWVQPWCRDATWDTRHSLWYSGSIDANYNSLYGTYVYSPTLYDADDFARDMADFAACAPKVAEASDWCKYSLDYAGGKGGQGALIYSIGLGKAVVSFRGGDPDAGDRLLRYAAAVGDDGDASTDLCAGYFPLDTDGDGIPTLTDGDDSYNCGNYYFTEFGSGLNAVFESIASRIFTRITH